MMKKDDENVEKKARETVDWIKRIEQKRVDEEKNVDKKMYRLLVLVNMNPPIHKTFPNKSELYYQLSVVDQKFSKDIGCCVSNEYWNPLS
jgi:hypothetical protein